MAQCPMAQRPPEPGGLLSNGRVKSLCSKPRYRYLASPKSIEPPLRYPRIPHSHFNRSVPKPFLDCPQINASISQSIAARMSEAVRMEVGEACHLRCSIDQIVDCEPAQPPSTFR